MSAACFVSSGQDADPAGSPEVFWLVLSSQERSFCFLGFAGFHHIYCELSSKPCGGGMTWMLLVDKTVLRSIKEIYHLLKATTLLKQTCIQNDFSGTTSSLQMLLHLTAGYGWWRSENFDLLFLWWIEFDARITVTNDFVNVAVRFHGFMVHWDDNLLLSDW